MNLSQELAGFGTGKTILMVIEDKKDLSVKTNRRNRKHIRKLLRAARRGERDKAIRESANDKD